MPLTERDYLFEERAAIAEFDGNLTREEAEALARREQQGAAVKAPSSAKPGIARASAPPPEAAAEPAEGADDASATMRSRVASGDR